MTEVKSSKDIEYVDAKVTVVGPVLRVVPALEAERKTFTRKDFESDLDKVSRPTGRGKLAHVRTNSDEFARRKQEEIELEERAR